MTVPELVNQLIKTVSFCISIASNRHTALQSRKPTTDQMNKITDYIAGLENAPVIPSTPAPLPAPVLAHTSSQAAPTSTPVRPAPAAKASQKKYFWS